MRIVAHSEGCGRGHVIPVSESGLQNCHTVTSDRNRVMVHLAAILFTAMTGPQPSAGRCYAHRLLHNEVAWFFT